MERFYFVLRAAIATFVVDCEKVSYLWKKVPSDCRLDLLSELFFNSAQLQRRYEAELSFEHSLGSRWSRR